MRTPDSRLLLSLRFQNTLSGVVNKANGWGVADDTRHMLGMMQQFGLNVVKPNAAAYAEWKQLIETKLYPSMRTQGMPSMAVGSCRRYDLAACVEWIQERQS